MESSEQIPYVAPTSNLTTVNLLNVTASSKEDALFTYLNTPGPSPKRTTDSFNSPSTTSSLLVEHPTDDTDSELSLHSDRVSPTGTHVSIDMMSKSLDDKNAEIYVEDSSLYVPDEMQIIDDKDPSEPVTDTVQNGIH